MSEWTVVTVLAAVVGLFFTVGKPILTLNSNIVKLNVTVEALNKEQAKQGEEICKQAEHAHEAHEAIWKHEAEQDDILRDHEGRLGRLEAQK